jgi:hypothetical protein
MRAARARAILARPVVVRPVGARPVIALPVIALPVIALPWPVMGALLRAGEAATRFAGAALRLSAARRPTLRSLRAAGKFAHGVAV